MNENTAPAAAVDLTAIEVRNLFPTPFIIYAMPDADTLNVDLRARIMARAASNNSVKKSNIQGWQSNDDFFEWGGPAAEAILQSANALIQEITRQYVPGEAVMAPFSGTWKVNGWANINRKGSSNEMHCHAGCFWSGVYYVDEGTTDAGENAAPLQLHDPRGVMPMLYAPTLRMGLRGCVSAGTTEAFFPKAGNLILFPSWLLHSVATQTFDAERISVAFNFSL